MAEVNGVSNVYSMAAKEELKYAWKSAKRMVSAPTKFVESPYNMIGSVCTLDPKLAVRSVEDVNQAIVDYYAGLWGVLTGVFSAELFGLQALFEK